MSSEIASVSRGHHLTAVINPCVWDPHFHARGGPCSWAEWGVHGQTHRIALEMQTGCSQQWHVIYDVGTHLRACRLPAEVQFPFRLRARMLLGLGRREPAEGNRAGECQARWQRLGLARKLRPRPLRRRPQARSRFAAADMQPRTLSPVPLLLCWGNT